MTKKHARCMQNDVGMTMSAPREAVATQFWLRPRRRWAICPPPDQTRSAAPTSCSTQRRAIIAISGRQRADIRDGAGHGEHHRPDQAERPRRNQDSYGAQQPLRLSLSAATHSLAHVGRARCCRQDDDSVQAQIGRGRYYHTNYWFQRRDCRAQELHIHGMGCRREGQNPSTLAPLLSEYPRHGLCPRLQ